MLNQQNWLTYMICYFIDSPIDNRNYSQIRCKNIKGLVWPIYWLTTKIIHNIIKSPVLVTCISNMIKVLSLDDKYIV